MSMQANNKKPAKSKQSQHNLLSSVLAQFDIQTQVTKMVIRSFDTLMRTNKQAFDFIKQSEHKFIQFQQRLSKAQTYYKNIQTNINSKVELTQNMNKRLQQFSTQFWSSIKQNNSQVTTMTKRFDQVLMQKRQLQNRMVHCEKQIIRVDNCTDKLNQKINDEVLKLVQMITQNEKKTDQRFITQSQQLRQLSQDIIQSRSLLQSKSAILTQLLTDLQIYKNDRPQIKLQLQTIFNELQNRALKIDVIQMRGYVDSKIIQQEQSTKKLWLRVDTQMKVLQRDRVRDNQRMNGVMKQTNLKLQSNTNQLQQLINTQIQKVQQLIKNTKQQSQQANQQLNVSISIINTKYDKQIPQLSTKLTQLQKSLLQTNQKLKSSQTQIQQLFSNNQSINQMIDMIVKQNQQRKQQLTNLTNNSQNNGNVQQQVLKLFEKFAQLEKQVVNINGEKLMKLRGDVDGLQKKLLSAQQHIESQVTKITNKLQHNHQQLSKSLQQTQIQLTNIITQNISQLNNKITTLNHSTTLLIQQKITSIQHKLNSLDQIHQQIGQFKQIFKKQLEQNEKVNQSIAEKMQRVMALFTKMKSDITVKFQTINSQLQKRSLQSKNCVNDLEEIKKYLSLLNQGVNLLLTTTIFNTTQQQSYQQSSSILTSTINNTTSQQKDEPQQNKPIKITSLLQGWIIQTDQSQQKIKYRGENFTISNRIKFLLSYLQFFIKKTQKIKGSILQNGRDIFLKVLSANEDMFSQRKRVTSKRKPSQLPKLHI